MIEVLVTLLLSVIVMSLTLQVIGTLRPKNNLQADVKDALTPRWAAPLLTQLNHDLAHAIEYKINENKLDLVTLNYLDPQTLVMIHRPTSVIYKISKTGRIYTLSRHQDLIGKRNNAKPLNQLIAINVTAFTINPPQPPPPEIEPVKKAVNATQNERRSEHFKLRLGYTHLDKQYVFEKMIISQ